MLNPASLCIFSQRVGAHDRAGAGRILIGHAHGQAVQDAPAVHHPFHIVAFGGEGIADAFIHDQHRAVLLHQPAHGLQCADRIGHVVDAFEGSDQIVLPGQRRIAGIPHLKVDAVRQPVPFGILLARSIDGASRSNPSTWTLG